MLASASEFANLVSTQHRWCTIQAIEWLSSPAVFVAQALLTMKQLQLKNLGSADVSCGEVHLVSFF